jgi:hypothetical protein
MQHRDTSLLTATRILRRLTDAGGSVPSQSRWSQRASAGRCYSVLDDVC